MERYARSKIDEAIAAGDLVPTVGVGEPIRDLTSDPNWWVRAFLRRESLEDRRTELVAHKDHLVALAVAADDLATAREQLAVVNHRLERWNEEVPPELSIETVSEIWLVSERAKAPGS